MQGPALSGNAESLPSGCRFPPEQLRASSENPHPKGEATMHYGKPRWRHRVRPSPAAHDQDCNERESDRGVALSPSGNDELLRRGGPFENVHCPNKPEHPDPLVAFLPPFHSERSPRPPQLFPKAPYLDCTRHPMTRAAFAKQIDTRRCRHQSFLVEGEQDRDSCAPSNIRDFLRG